MDDDLKQVTCLCGRSIGVPHSAWQGRVDGARVERERIRAGVLAYYKVAPKAAESILKIIDGES